MKFNYIAKRNDGQVIKGVFEASGKQQALNSLSSMNLQVLSITEIKQAFLKMPTKVGKKQIAIILRQMSTMINASIPIPVVLTILRDDEKNSAVKEMLTNLNKAVTDGTSLSSAMGEYPKYFSPFVLNMVEMGEVNGQLDTAFERIATVTEKEIKVMGKAKSALIYPIILLVLAVAMTIFLSVKVVPTFAQLFLDFGGELPGITKVMLAISDFLQGYWYVLIAAVIGIVIAVKYLWKKRESRRYMERILRKIPVYKGIVISKIMGKYSRVVSSMRD